MTDPETNVQLENPNISLNRFALKQGLMAVMSGALTLVNTATYIDTQAPLDGLTVAATLIIALMNGGLYYKSKRLIRDQKESNDISLNRERLLKVAEHLKLSGEALIGIAGTNMFLASVPTIAKYFETKSLPPKEIVGSLAALAVGGINIIIGKGTVRMANKMEVALKKDVKV